MKKKQIHVDQYKDRKLIYRFHHYNGWGDIDDRLRENNLNYPNFENIYKIQDQKIFGKTDQGLTNYGHNGEKTKLDKYYNHINIKLTVVAVEDLKERRKIMKQEIKTKEQVRELGLKTFSAPNGDGTYKDAEGYYHLFRDGKEILPEVKKLAALSYSNGDGEYKDIDGYYHLFRNEKELLPEIKKLNVYSHSNGNGQYKDIEGYYHLIRYGEEVIPEIKKVNVDSYSNGDGTYKDTKGYTHLIRNGEELLPKIEKLRAYSYPNGTGEYMDTKGEGHRIKGEENE